MKRLQSLMNSLAGGDPRRGSALLVSLMVMVGLSLLGLSFVAISETESAISAHERDAQQALDGAELGAKVVVEMFQDPEWAASTTVDILPGNRDEFKRNRVVADGVTDKYKPSTGQRLFDKPFKPNQPDRFFGDEAHADVQIDYTTTEGTKYLNKLNRKLFAYTGNITSGNPSQVEGGAVRIVEILAYAPPIIDGTFNTSTGFWSRAGIRYGIATIKVTAMKFRPGYAPLTGADTMPLPLNKAIASRWVRMVVSEWPFPGPQGPIQSNANIQTGGNFGVHWGRMTASGNIDVKIPLTGLNWYDAWERPHFEHGYDSSEPWARNTAYQLGMKVHPSTGPAGWTYVCTRAGNSGPSEPAWPAVATCGTNVATCGTIDDPNSSGVQWTQRYEVLYPNTGAGGYRDDIPWLLKLINQTYDDPWSEVRARGTISNATSQGDTNPQPYPFQDVSQSPTATPRYGYSSWFQLQTTSDTARPSYRKQVIFPRIDYNFWKDIAVTGAGTQGVYYLRWVAGGDGDLFTDGISTKKFAKWVNTVTGAQAGFYFFDTQNRQNPQGAGAPGTLTPSFSVNSSDDGHRLGMAGFIYLNAEAFATTGITGPDAYLNFPGEPYRDVGYRKVNVTNITGTPNQIKGDIFIGDGGTLSKTGASNQIWDCEDLPWSNSGTDGKTAYATDYNNQCDIYVKAQNVRMPDGTIASQVLPVEWYPGCHPGDNFHLDGGTPDPVPCSEPHEPYINLRYPNSGGLGKAKQGGNIAPIPTGWLPYGTETRLPKRTQSGAPVSCTPGSSVSDCTSESYDRDGPLTDDISPMLNGIMYIEGDFGADDPLAGNAQYYGSLLIQGSVRGQGTPEVWFDEKLIKEEWPPSSMRFPRVYVSAQQTDQ
jgi:hypothetical protein